MRHALIALPVACVLVHPAEAKSPKGDLASFNSHDTQTASGERFDPKSLTAAHRSLPFGTQVRVTNLWSHKSVVVRINDRGPYTGRRVIDLTTAGAKAIGMLSAGVVPVKLEILPAAPRQVASVPDSGRPSVHSGSPDLPPGPPMPRAAAEPPTFDERWQGDQIPLPPPKPQITADPVSEYLCEVYRRMPSKVDSSGDFTWKDKAAAQRKGLSLCQYAINGMHLEMREKLYTLGQKIDASGVKWSFLSGFRDDYRQRIASGFKARGCGSLHGGSCRTTGYGGGLAADVWQFIDGEWISNANPLFQLIDKLGRALGLVRPMPGRDPGHVQLADARGFKHHHVRVAKHHHRASRHRYAHRHVRHHRRYARA